MILKHVLLGLVVVLGAGCASQPKQTLEAQVPPDFSRGDVELAILLATGLVPPDAAEKQHWTDFEKACLRNAGRLQISGPDLQEEDHWIFETSESQSIRTSYRDGVEKLVAKVEYDPKRVRISMTESRNLGEKGDSIDPLANEWLDDLRSKVIRGMGRVQLMKRNFEH